MDKLARLHNPTCISEPFAPNLIQQRMNCTRRLCLPGPPGCNSLSVNDDLPRRDTDFKIASRQTGANHSARRANAQIAKCAAIPFVVDSVRTAIPRSLRTGSCKQNRPDMSNPTFQQESIDRKGRPAAPSVNGQQLPNLRPCQPRISFLTTFQTAQG